jgi:hypothetical protein
MKMNDRKTYRIRKVRTMQELKQEQTRLQFEVRRSEDQVRGNYRNLKDALTFANILANLLQEVAVTSSLLSKAVEVGRTFFANRKKKKKKRKEEQEQAGGNTMSNEGGARNP